MHSGTNIRLVLIPARISIYKRIMYNSSLTKMKRYKKESRKSMNKEIIIFKKWAIRMTG